MGRQYPIIELTNRAKFATTVFPFNDDLQYLMLTFPQINLGHFFG